MCEYQKPRRELCGSPGFRSTCGACDGELPTTGLPFARSIAQAGPQELNTRLVLYVRCAK